MVTEQLYMSQYRLAETNSNMLSNMLDYLEDLPPVALLRFSSIINWPLLIYKSIHAATLIHFDAIFLLLDFLPHLQCYQFRRMKSLWLGLSIQAQSKLRFKPFAAARVLLGLREKFSLTCYFGIWKVVVAYTITKCSWTSYTLIFYTANNQFKFLLIVLFVQFVKSLCRICCV